MVTAYCKKRQENSSLVFSLFGCANEITSRLRSLLETPKYTRLFSVAFCNIVFRLCKNPSNWEGSQLCLHFKLHWSLYFFGFTVVCAPDGALGALHHGQKHWRVCRLMWPFIQSSKDSSGTCEFCIERDSLQKFSGPVICHLKDSKAT